MEQRIGILTTTSMALRYLLLGRLRALREAGWQVTGICGDSQQLTEVERAGFHVDVIPMVRELHPLKDSVSLVALTRYFRKNRFDVLATHTPKAGLLGPLAAKLAGIPLILHTAHGLLFHDQMPSRQREAGRLAERWTALFADHLLFQSREDWTVALELRLKKPERLHWVGNGIDLERFNLDGTEPARTHVRAELGLHQTQTVIGTVGRLVWEKGYRELFAAAETLCRHHPEIRFLVVGPAEEGQQRDAVPEEEIKKLARRGYITFAGHRDDMPELYAAMDLFVLASYREGIPRALMEAMAMGLPVIATNIRGVRELVEDRVSGLLIAPRNSATLAEAIEGLLRDPHRRTALGRAAQCRAQTHFSEKAVHERFLAILQRIMQNARGA